MYDSEESISDDEISFGKKCFDVEVPDDFDPNIVPTNGIEYLQLCMYEAKKRPRVVYMTEEQKMSRGLQIGAKIAEKSSMEQYEFDEFFPVSKQMEYSLSWLLEKELDFKKLRDYIWCQYHYDDRLSRIGKNCPKITENLFIEQIPNLEMLVDMPPFQMNACLTAITNILYKTIDSKKSIPYNLGMWIYILIAANFKYADGTMANIRKIARMLSQIRYKLGESVSVEEYMPINLITALVGHTLGQYDLSDNTEVTKNYCKQITNK